MTKKFVNNIEIDAPIEEVYKYHVIPENMGEGWIDVVQQPDDISPLRVEEGTEIKVKGGFMGEKREMKLQVIDTEENKRLITKQAEGPFRNFEAIQIFEEESDKQSTHVRYTIQYDLTTRGKVEKFLTHNQIDNKIEQGLKKGAQTVKLKIESSGQKESSGTYKFPPPPTPSPT